MGFTPFNVITICPFIPVVEKRKTGEHLAAKVVSARGLSP